MGFAYHERPVSATTAKEVIRHRLQKTRPRVAWGWATAVGLLAIVGVVAVMLQGDQGLLARRLIDQVSAWQADPAAPTPTAVESQTSEAIAEAGSTRGTESTAMEPEPDSVLAGGADFEAQSQTLELDPERASASLGAKVEKTAAATDGAVQGAASPETEAIPEAVVATEGSVERGVSETAATDAAVQGAASPETETMLEPVVATEGSVEQDVSETEDELVAVSIPERTEKPITAGESSTMGKPDLSSERPLGDRQAELAVAEIEPISVETRPASAVKPASRSPVLRLAKFVKSGDTLGNLCIEVYGPGYANHDVFAQLKEANPNLIDENLILPGQWIVFPELPDPLS
jgi:phage tail protein X